MKKIVLIFAIINSLQAQWQAIDSASFVTRIPAGKNCYISFEKSAESLAVTLPQLNLTNKAHEATAYAPAWLSIALEDKFSALSNTLQDRYAQIILDAQDPCVDEIAFTIAHLSVEILTNDDFYPDVITENALEVYASDSDLDYVAIVDTGSAASGGYYFSTTRYKVEENGTVNEYSLPMDIYYWYIVHPKLQGEMVSYINLSSGYPQAPPEGKFWRSYLFDHSEGQYPALRDTMNGITTLWNCRTNDPANNGALGRLTQWCNHTLPWGTAVTPRIPQPVRLYHLHTGTCSEHGWFASAAARAVLIPATLTKGARFDHKWNEFYERGWKDWEPVNGWINRQADDYWEDPSKPNLNGCFNWRGDGFIWGTTEHYSNVCTLAITVKDANDNPVDGARVTVDANGVGGPFLMVGWTGCPGMCRLLLGDSISSFTAAIQSSVGNKAAQQVITNSMIGKKYPYSPSLSGTITQLKAEPCTVTVDSSDKYKIEYRIDASTEIVYGKHEYSFSGYSFPCTFADSRKTGNTNFFICDEDNFNAYTGGNTFNAADSRKNAADIDSSFIFPDDKRWYAVLSNENKVVNTTVAEVTVKLLKMGVVPVIIDNAIPRLHGLKNVSNPPGKPVLFSYSLVKSSDVSLSIYNTAGRPVKTLIKKEQQTGNYTCTWRAGKITRGIYYYVFRIGKKIITGKLIII